MKQRKKSVAEKDNVDSGIACVADGSKKIVQRRKKIKKKKQCSKRNKYLHLVLNKDLKTIESVNQSLSFSNEQNTSTNLKKRKKSTSIIKVTKDATDEEYDEEKMEDLRKNVKLIIKEFEEGEKNKQNSKKVKLKKRNLTETPGKRKKISQNIESDAASFQSSDDEMQSNQFSKKQIKTDQLNSRHDDALESQSSSFKCEESRSVLQENDEFKILSKKRPTVLYGSEEILQRSRSLKQRMLDQLKGSQFRYLNEKLYTMPGKEAKKIFGENLSMFQEYHSGYQNQVLKWPMNPLDIIIKDIQSRSSSLVIADFGCGDASLAKTVSNKVHSFDLVALNDLVTVCNMAKVPLRNEEVDIVVFCLSLMGTNLSDYIKEGHRVLKMKGRLLIAEVESRFQNIDTFVKSIEKHGFQLIMKNEDYKMFVLFEFQKSHPKPKKVNCEFYLKPCLYKKR